MRHEPDPRLTIALFFSGYAALAYEMIWVRQLVMLLGVTYFAITTIVAVFMAGIALGSVAAGRLVDRRSAPLLPVFAALEIFLGLYAQLVHFLIQALDGVYLQLVSGTDLPFTAHAGLRAAFALIVLLPPTLASGATLPVACKAFIHSGDGVGRGVARLYGANLLGSTLGAFATTFFVIGLLGFPAAVHLGTAANVAAAALALSAWRRLRRVEAAPSAAPARQPPAWGAATVVVAMAYLVTGFVTMADELLWTRVLSQIGFNPSTAVFALVLVVYLVGHSVGALLLYPVAARRVAPERLFWSAQIAMAVLCLLGAASLAWRHGGLSPVGPLQALGMVLPWQRAWALVPGVLLPAMCTGLLFPLASQLAIRDERRVGTGVGALAGLSTVGGILGSLLTGCWLMPRLGAVPALVVFSLLPIATGAWSWWGLAPRGERAPWPRLALLTALLALTTLLAARLTPPWLHLNLFPGERVQAFVEGLSSASAVVESQAAGCELLVSGERVQGGGSSLLLASRLHPDARRAAVIGMGTGTMVAQALEQSDLEQVVAVDIDGNLPALAPWFLGPAAAHFAPPRFRFVEDDGRHFLRTDGAPFDIIVNDAAIYAWYLELSTLEFNQLVKARLAPEGLYVGRLHLVRITPEALADEVATFLQAFPNAAFWQSSPDIGMLVGRNGTEPIDERVRLEAGARLGYRVTWDAAALRDLAEEGRIIRDQYPMHLPDIFVKHGAKPIIEFTPPADLPQGGAAGTRRCTPPAPGGS
ncbi:MAG: fused MFS/spermidine synthase [Pseudomonadota bacterium]